LGQNERIFLHQCHSQIIHFSYSETLNSSEIDMYYIYLMLILFIPVKKKKIQLWKGNFFQTTQYVKPQLHRVNFWFSEMNCAKQVTSITSNPIIVLKDAFYFFFKKKITLFNIRLYFLSFYMIIT